MNIESEIKGNSELYEYSGRINCPMETGHRRALFIAGTYTKPPPGQNPTFVRYVMKKGFGKLYWSTLSGRWNWLFDLYFGKTTTPLKLGAFGTGRRTKGSSASTKNRLTHNFENAF